MLSNDAPDATRSDVMPPHAWISRLAAVALAFFALTRCVRFTTPIDTALPFIGIALLLGAMLTRSSLSVALPAFAAVAILVPDERTRLLAYGLIAAFVFAGGIALREIREPLGLLRSIAIALLAVLLIRWIPWSDVLLFRELLLLALTAAIVAMLGGGPFAIAAAVLVALFTPAIPMRTLALPLVVLAICAAGRFFRGPRLRLTVASSALLGASLLFFPWSGVVARALPLVVNGLPRSVPRQYVGVALGPAKSVTLDVPAGATALVVSGANVPRLRRGSPLGRIYPGGRTIVIGDAADWGALRRSHFYGASNPLPRDPAGVLRDYGYSAWVDGAGRVPLPRGASSITITADASLPRNATLQVEGFEGGVP